MFTGMPGERARTLLAATRFADVRWSPETGSTNADALALADDGAPEGIVVVADHQAGGRGRHGRRWEAPPGASLLCSVLLRPPAAVAGLTTVAVAVAAAEAVTEVTGVTPRLKWPNDLVWPGDGSGPDRKLAGILAEAQAGAVVVGIGVNVNWPHPLPEDLAHTAVALNHITGADMDRERLLAAFLLRLDHQYTALLAAGGGEEVVALWRARSATLGRQVRVETGGSDVEGKAVDVTPEGHLVVETGEGERRTFAVGDVIHLR